MRSFLLVFALLFPSTGATAPQQKQERCARAYARAVEAWTQKRFGALPSLARRARRCYGATAPGDRLMELYFYEASALRTMNRPEEAFETLGRFFKRFSAPPDSLAPMKARWYREMHRQRGYLYYEQGNLAEAARNYARAVSYAGAASVRWRARLLVDLGYVFQRMRAFSSARRRYQRAEALLQALQKEGDASANRKLRARVLLARADLLLEESAQPKDATEASRRARWREVVQRGNRALTLLGSLSGAASEEYRLHARVLLADAHGNLGHLRQAHRQLDRAERRAWRRGNAHWQFWLLCERGELYMRTDALKQAEASFLKALEKIDQARHSDYRRQLLTDLGSVYESLKRPAQAEEYYRRAISIVEAYRAALGATDWAAQAFAQWQTPYRGLVRALLAQHKPRAAFRVLGRSRARHLRDLRTQARMLSTLNPAQRRRFDSLTTTLNGVRTRLGSDTLRSPARARLLQRKTRLMAERRALAPSATPPSDSLSLPAVQRALAPRNRVLLSYFIDDDGDDDPAPRRLRSTVFVVTKNRFTAVPLASAPADTLAALLDDVSPLLSGGSRTNLNAMHFVLTPLKALYDRIFAPLEAYIPARAPLIIVPDGPLFALPFSALVMKETPAYRYRDAPFLLRRHPITTELAASLLPSPSRSASPKSRPSSRAAADTTALDVAAFGKARFADLSSSEAFQNSAFSSATLTALPGVEREIEAVHRLFPEARVAVGPQATEPNLTEALRHAEVVHIASHAFASEFAPLQSAILMSPDRTETASAPGAAAALQSASDGLLHLHELPQDHLSTQLAVLSGCSTARGALRQGEGMAGLQYAFRSAGVGSTLSMLWPAEDRTSVQLMKRFYRHLRAGQPKDVALQKAQLAFLKSDAAQQSNPFFWAAPLLYGDAAPLTPAAPPPLLTRYWNAALGIGLCALLIVGAFVYRRFI